MCGCARMRSRVRLFLPFGRKAVASGCDCDCMIACAFATVCLCALLRHIVPRQAGGRVCVLRLCHRSVARVGRRGDVVEPHDQRAVGGRWGHTTAIDAAGAIYVIGGVSYNGGIRTDYSDVWVSTGGGADWTCARGVLRGCSRVVLCT